MHLKKDYFSRLLFFLLSVLLLQASACKKEHSCEGCLSPKPPRHDTSSTSLPSAASILPNCSSCTITNDISTGTWNFTIANTYVCGAVTDCGFIGGRTAFTFFGPSACSLDTGLVITVYLPVSFDKDMDNIISDDDAFYYYDDQAPQDILIKKSTAPFSVTVQHFLLATGLTTGTFQGTVYKADGSTAIIENGRFQIQLK